MTKIKTKHIFFIVGLLLLLNTFDAVYTLHVMDAYDVPEQNGFVAMIMEEGLFILLKIGLPALMGLVICLEVKKFTDKQLRYTFAVIKLGILFYAEINTFNILFIYHYFNGL